jgi:hypothetical protein
MGPVLCEKNFYNSAICWNLLAKFGSLLYAIFIDKSGKILNGRIISRELEKGPLRDYTQNSFNY